MKRSEFLDKRFFSTVLSLALPLTLQSFIMSSVNMVDVVMIGRLGDVDIAAVGVANQIFFLLSLIFFGVNTGAAVFIAQFWGKRDVANIRRTMGLMFSVGLFASVVFTTLTTLCPQALMRIYSKDPAVIEAGARYLRIVGMSYIVTGFSYSYGYACRCTGGVRLPMIASITSVITNTVLNYAFIFGQLGAPRLGLAGAAIATVIARVAEFLIIVLTVYLKDMPAAARPRELFDLDGRFIRRYAKTAAPVLVNECVWSLGTTMYTVVYGILGTQALASIQIASTVFNLFTVLTKGASDASAIMIGNKIGAGDEAGAMDDGLRFMALLPAVGLCMGGLLLALRPAILTIFNVSDLVAQYTWQILGIQALVLAPKAFNMVLVVGICRSGGDTLFACLIDTLPIWLCALPLAFLGAKLGLPVYLVYLLICSEEVLKAAFGVPRVLSKKWVHNVVSALQDG